MFSLLPVELPTIAEKTLNSLASLTTPLALLSIGASFEGTKALKKSGPHPGGGADQDGGPLSHLHSLRCGPGLPEKELVALLIMLGSPTTPSSYVMVKTWGTRVC